MNDGLAAAITRRITGQRVTQRDQRLLAKHDKAESERHLRAVPRVVVRAMTGRTQAQLERIEREHGIPVSGAEVNMYLLVPALLNRVLDVAEAEAADGDSPALERLRAARADMAELDRDRMVGTLLPRVETHEALAGVAAIIRLAGERLEMEYGPDARAILDEALDEADAGLDAAFAEPQNGGPGPARG